METWVLWWVHCLACGDEWENCELGDAEPPFVCETCLERACYPTPWDNVQPTRHKE